MIELVEFGVELFVDPHDKRRSELALLQMIECLARIDVGELEAFNYPPIYKSGVKYGEPGKKRWQDIHTTYRRRIGDCKDLAAWRIAEQRRKGIACRPFLKWTDGGTMYHVQVYYDHSKRVEDPSYVLGMGKDKNA